ncbi:MAG: glucosamine-6-phosphate deaminase [Prolixibacteraceae bacterium]
MKLVILKNYEEISGWAARYTAKKINDYQPTPDKPFVLGLPTGSSPMGMYAELISMYKSGMISFENVVTFNMDEYAGLPENHPESYHSFMQRHLFDHINIRKDSIHIPDGNAPDLMKECNAYEEKIKSYGGIRLFLGGMGADGHIAFNVPGSSLYSRTRLVNLNYETIAANARFFDNELMKVPKQALTVGVQTIMDAEEVMIVVSGLNKARALQKVVEGGINHMWTLSALQNHPNAIIVCDEKATWELKTGTVNYFKELNNADNL